MKYKVLEDHSSHFIVHDGKSQFKVAKKGLSKPMMDKISALKVQKFDDGGSVVDVDQMMDPATIPQADAPPPPATDIRDTLGNIHQYLATPTPSVDSYAAQQFGYQPQGAPTAAVSAPVEAPNLQEPSPIPAAAPPSAPSVGAQGGVGSDMQKAMGLEMSGIDTMSKAQQQQAHTQEGLYQQYQDSLKALQQRTDQQLADNEHESDQLKANIQNGKIDPHRLWSNTSTGNKVLGAIGLILGGMGGQGHGNMALDVMQKAIDRDIDAQKEDINNNKTLLNFNIKKYGDIRTAEAATRVQLGSVLQAQLGMAAAQSGSQMAIANAELAKGAIQSKMIPYKMQIADAQIKSQSFGGMPANGQVDQYLMRTDPKYAAQRVTVNGQVYRHTGDVKAANEQRTFESRLAPIEAAVRELDSLGPAATVRGSAAYNRAEAIRAGLGTSIAGLRSTQIGSTRINEQEVNAALKQISDPTSFSQMLNGGVRNQEFFKDLHNSADEARTQNLVGYRGMSSVPGRTQGWK